MAGTYTEKDALDFLFRECLDVRCVAIRSGGDDADVGWEIVQHFMAPPKERVIGRGDTPFDAIQNAHENFVT